MQRTRILAPLAALLAVLGIAFAGVANAEPITLQVLHRVDGQSYTPRGHITYDPTSLKNSANSFEADVNVAEFFSKANHPPADLYHLQLKSAEDATLDLKVAVPLCLLHASQYQETLTLHLDQDGKPWHADYHVKANSCEQTKPTTKSPKMKVKLNKAVEGVRPKLELIPDTPDGKPPAEQSWIKKYWYIILPVMIILMMGGGSEEGQAGAKA
ncbi:hypothetical protein BC832DRAFT_565507 [Gaertneriomyces semiglobifer]|nr:hypothetical protein BC832DRAFT_565507 [Gaertneriomyces semiglobifer]